MIDYEKLERHRLMQMDENRYVSKRMDEQEKCIVALQSLVNDLRWRMNDCEKIETRQVLCECCKCNTKQPATVLSSPLTFVCFKCLYKEHGVAALRMGII